MSSLRLSSLLLVCSGLVLAGCSCPEGFLQFRKSCYWFSNIVANFAEARSYCGFLESHLAIITSKEEDDFVRGIARNKTGRHFLGASDLNTDEEWRWEGGGRVTYTNWGAGEPSTKAEHCLDLLHSDHYLWNDAYCSTKQKFICETCFR